ncbi:MAG: 23S rRNA (guanosine2251-2'-O)-methyltransferase [Alphaproteobacteria bacterium]|nr:MAG: 23S rRNA (guanosine2251-2'-O)-methyltransferase [Caulobacteraceae bacterium]TPW02450.1 MAG: 23S rRNA (guanosine2251-2'-O)-methyltransferase [Alphaproteobacteria bacterium]
MRSSPPLNRRGSGKGHQGKGGQRPDGDAADTRWIWGVHAALAALANPARTVERLVASRNAADRLPHGTKVEVLEPDAIDRLLPMGAVHQGLAVRCAPLEPEDLLDTCTPPDGRPVLVLDSVTDPQNVGAIFRSAAAFGARAIVMQDRKSPPLTGALAKAAAGAIEIVPHARVVNIARAIEELAEAGYVTVGLEGEADMSLAQALDDLRPPVIVLGAEGAGLRDLVAKTCDVRARIPIAPHMESLNVSVAAAVALYEAARRRS